ncbi:MAG: HAD family hydrolase [Candidatus Bipolaricaulota bacterium]|nr:MAG: HAD family hydrolase [Candidatus Bipolaricaulota bacterium]
MVGRHIEAVIWDFNGTLIDDIDPVVASVNTQLAKRGLPAVTAAKYREVFGFPVEDYYRRLGLEFETETIADLAADFFAEYRPRLKDCALHEGVVEALKRLSSRGMRQFVLSAMEEGMLHSMLEHVGIARFFEGAYGLAHQEGDSKISRGRELLRDYAVDPEAALLVGDTDHDAEVGAALGVRTILVANGHQTEARLRATGSETVATVHELLDRIIQRP